ncbi:MAG: type 4 pilus major pilin [Rhodobacteraceae bacterium]|nr:type 4 pilus major pilin [Paracoccaceae bacterium]
MPIYHGALKDARVTRAGPSGAQPTETLIQWTIDSSRNPRKKKVKHIRQYNMIKGCKVSGSDASPKGGALSVGVRFAGAAYWTRAKRADVPGRSARRGVTLIEAVLFIAVALGLIVGGLVFYQQASLAARTQEAVRQFSAIVNEARALYKGQAMAAVVDASAFAGPTTDITAVLISAGAVPPEMVASATRLQNPWGGTTTVYAYSWRGSPRVVILSDRVPREVCTRLLSSDSAAEVRTVEGFRATNIVADSMWTADANTAGQIAPPWEYVLSPSGAANMCEWGYWTPDSARLSGNTRYITMGFNLY